MKIINCEETSKINELDDELYKYINQKIDFSNDIIKTFPKSFVNERFEKLKFYIKQLGILRKKPLLKQRTIEWLDARKNILTASDLEEAIGKSCNKLAKKKAGVIINNINYSSIPALKWGTMFEEMATRCYSQKRKNIEIYEFGLIIDEKQDHFGASPDGINEHGVMIEIKCPYSRKIKDGSIPNKYYMQIQGQLATCCLEDCDYIECDFKTFQNLEEYLSNINENILVDHGVIAEYKNVENGEFIYLYSDPYQTPADAIANIQDQVLKNQSEYNFLKYTPWSLQQINVQRVSFDKDQWVNISEKIQNFWNHV